MAEEKISESAQKDIVQLQNIQRQFQLISSQRQRFELEVMQMDSALDELKKASGKTYKAIGTLLIEDKPESIKEDLNKRKKDLKDRISTLKKQEERLKSKNDDLQAKVQKSLEKAS